VLPDFLKRDEDDEPSTSPVTPEEAAGYYWAEDEVGDVVMVYVNSYQGEVSIKDLGKERVYHSFGDIKLIEKVDFPDDYDELETEDRVEEALSLGESYRHFILV